MFLDPKTQAQFDYTMIGRNRNPYAPVSEAKARRTYDEEFKRLEAESAESEELVEITA